MFKSVTLYRINPDFNPDLVTVEEALNKSRFVECAPTQPASSGWIPPRGQDGALAESVDGQIIARLRTDTRPIPSKVVAKRVDEMAASIEEQTGRKPGKRERREIKESAIQELLPHAFIKTSVTTLWIDRKGHWLVIDSTSTGTTDVVVSMLIKALDGLKVMTVATQHSPVACMSGWLGTGEAPAGFTVDRECELRSCDEMKSVIRYGRYPLDTEEVKQHIAAGKVPAWLALTWQDKISFVLTDSLRLKKVEFLGVASMDHGKDDSFDADVAIAVGGFQELFQSLLDALGGEQLDNVAAEPDASQAAT